MSEQGRAVLRVVWTGLFAVLFTAAISFIWGAFLTANLKTSAAIPWAVIPMALVLRAAWGFLDGRWGLPRSQAARHALLRSQRLPRRVAAWSIAAGVLWMIALAGLWITLHRLMVVQTNPLPDFSRYPAFTVIAALAMASISGAVSEEAAFRGYFLSALERAGLGRAAVLAAALLMAPQHALTQGFVWPNVLFYLLFDGMQGAIAYVTGSIRPGVVVHAIGLFIFFYMVWPHDAARTVISVHGPDAWFWIHLGQTVVFAALSLAAFAYLMRLAREPGEPKSAISPGA
jgi:membrane protease YdiL (CAAX protease family)